MKTLVGGTRLLIIEDEEILLQILSKKLIALGYEVHSATDGEKGFELIKELHPDLVLLDMMLPKLDGPQILAKLNQEKILPALPILIISNSGQPVEVDQAIKLGVRGYIVKVNFDPQKVITKVKEILANEAEKTTSDMQPAQVKIPNQGASKNTLENIRILLVEDDLFILQLLNDKLRKSSCITFIASDAETALGILKKESVDLVLLDVILPGMDGFTFLQQLKASEEFKKIPVIFLSNLGQREEIERGMKIGALDYIIKANNSPSEILARIKKIMREHTT